MVAVARDRLETEAHQATVDGVSPEGPFIRKNLPRRKRLATTYLYPILAALLSTFSVFAFFDAFNHQEGVSQSRWWTAAIAVFAGMIATALIVERDRHGTPNEHRLSSFGYYVMRRFIRAHDEAHAAGKNGVPGAQAVTAAISDMVDGFEELVLEREKVSDEKERHTDLIRREYVAALDELADSLKGDILDVLAEVTVAAQVLFAARDDLLVTVASSPAPDAIDVDALRMRTRQAQERLEAGRARLVAASTAS